MLDSLERKPLFDLTQQQNFQIGAPHWFAPPGLDCCAVAGYDYSGADPRIQFPAGWHVRAGKGTKASGAVHQDAFSFQPDRVQVIPYPTELGVPINIIRLVGDIDDGRTGGAMLIHPTATVNWTDGRTVRAYLTFSPRSEAVTARRFINFGLRGILSFTPTQESVSIAEIALLENKIKVLLWRDGISGEGSKNRRVYALAYPFALDKWYKLMLEMRPLRDEENTWETAVKLVEVGNARKRLIWRTRPDERMNQGIAITQLACGDEHQGMADGGVYYIARLGASVKDNMAQGDAL